MNNVLKLVVKITGQTRSERSQGGGNEVAGSGLIKKNMGSKQVDFFTRSSPLAAFANWQFGKQTEFIGMQDMWKQSRFAEGTYNMLNNSVAAARINIGSYLSCAVIPANYLYSVTENRNC